MPPRAPPRSTATRASGGHPSRARRSRWRSPSRCRSGESPLRRSRPRRSCRRARRRHPLLARSRTSRTWTSCSMRRRRPRTSPGTRPTGSTRSRRSSCRGRTRMPGPAARSSGSAAVRSTPRPATGVRAPTTPTTSPAPPWCTCGTGQLTGARRAATAPTSCCARSPICRRPTGPNAGNVVLWMQPDGTLNPSAEPVELPDPVRLRTELLARAHDLGARRGLRRLPGRRSRIRRLPGGPTGALGRRGRTGRCS